MKPYFERNGITIYHGDCREVLPTLEPVDLVLTDPPYGIEGSWRGGNSHGWGRFRGEAEKWDQRPDWVPELIWRARETIIWGGNYFGLPASGSWLVWDKVVRDFTAGHCELAWTNLGKPVRAFNWSHGALAAEGKEHPTQKPVALMRWCIGLASEPETILDPFMGSGTTLRAAMDLGRKAVGVEIEERYCEIAAKRLEQQVLAL